MALLSKAVKKRKLNQDEVRGVEVEEAGEAYVHRKLFSGDGKVNIFYFFK